LDSLVVPDKKFHVETNGTLIPTEELSLILPDGKTMKRTAMQADVISKFNWVVSPKMNNARQKLNRTAMNYWVKETACIFKFIIQNRSDITEIEEVEKQFGIPKKRIFIGLEGVTAESQTQPDLVDEIIQKGYNFSPRLHILLWGTRRGK
jgi:organic radical activating enzyme